MRPPAEMAVPLSEASVCHLIQRRFRGRVRVRMKGEEDPKITSPNARRRGSGHSLPQRGASRPAAAYSCGRDDSPAVKDADTTGRRRDRDG